MILEIKQKIEKSRINTSPFPHIVIKNLLSKSTLKKLNKTLPNYDDIGDKNVIFQSSSETKKTIMPDTKHFKNLLKKKKFKNLNKKFKKYKKKQIYCTILLSGSSEIKKLNKKFRNKNKSTDVLSFPFYNKKDLKKKLNKTKQVYLGDIIINLNKIKNKKNKSIFKDEFNKLWIHGLTHLFGHDHKKNKDFRLMKKIEDKYFNLING